MRHCLALDLKDDPALIAEYEAYHRYRLGTRMVMLMETDDARYDAEAMAAATRDDPKIRAWEELMWKFQSPTPWTPAGEKWVGMQRIFEL